jgi:import receptor subunit TOM20
VKEARKLQKQAAVADARRREATAEKLKTAILEIQRESAPDPGQQEQYFMEQLAVAEQLATRGADYHVEAATHFYKALRVYPAPSELITIYEKTQPTELFSLIMAL